MNNFKHAARALTRKPAFAAAAVVVLALGIGANAAIFSLVDAFLFKPLQIHQPGRLVGLYSRNATKPGSFRSFSYPNFVDLRDRSAVFSSLAAHHLQMAGLTEGTATRRLFVDLVSSNYFDTMGVRVLRGRRFSTAEEQPGAAASAVIVSYSFWKRHGSDPATIGRTLLLNGRWFTVVGITPEGFTGTTALISAEIYAPLGAYDALTTAAATPGHLLASRDHHTLIPLARLHPGVTLASADSQLASVAVAMQKAWPAENHDQTLLVRPLSRLSVSDSPGSDSELAIPAILLLSMAGIVLIVASLNVANMMLARGAARRKEIAIRLALGGGRRHIPGQLLAESFLLAAAGGAAGLLVAWWSTGLMVSSMFRMIPIDLVFNPAPDLRVLAATFAFCLLSTLLFGLMPAWSLTRPNLVTGLKDGQRDPSGSRLFSRGNLLVMAQICLSLALLTTAGLFTRGALRAANFDPGFRVSGSILVELDPSLAGYSEPRTRQSYRALLERLQALPGVESATLAATVPFGTTSNGNSFRPAEAATALPNPVNCRTNSVGSAYFSTMGIPLLRGRTFLAAETASTSVVIDRLAAARLFPSGDALGKRILLASDSAGARPLQVAGIVGTVREHIVGRDEAPHVYFPLGPDAPANLHIHLKAANDAALLDIVRREIHAFDPGLPVLALRTMRQHLDGSVDLWITRTAATLFSIFAGVALLLAAIGLYGVRSFAVARRTREIGIRMALGATAADTLRLVLREGAALSAIGAGTGLALSFLLGKVLAGLLFEVSPSDPAVFLTAPAILTAVSLAACYLPARRAARIDPMVALRDE